MELIQGDSGTQDFSKADMFSMGASLYEMCSGEPLSAGSQEDSSQWHDLRKGLLFREKYNIKLEFLGNDEGFTSVVNTNRNPVWDNYPNDILAVLEEVIQLINVFLMNNYHSNDVDGVCAVDESQPSFSPVCCRYD